MEEFFTIFGLVLMIIAIFVLARRTVSPITIKFRHRTLKQRRNCLRNLHEVDWQYERLYH